MKPLKNIAFIANLHKDGAHDLAKKLAEKVEATGGSVEISTSHSPPRDFLKDKDACCVIGGDGTLLSAVQESIKYQTPVFGINQGKLGFLATFAPEDVLDHFETILTGHYNITPRFILSCNADGKEPHMALNDVVLKHKNSSRLITIEVYSNEEFVTTYSGDGLIFSTPTGSTAYNLSAGGPIIYPGAKVFVMTPICAHTLSNRTVVFDHNSTIKAICPDSDVVVQVTPDGRTPFEVKANTPIYLQIPEITLPLLQPMDYSHFRILRNKLGWGD